MIVVLIDDGHIDITPGQVLGGVEPTEAGAEDNDALPHSGSSTVQQEQQNSDAGKQDRAADDGPYQPVLGAVTGAVCPGRIRRHAGGGLPRAVPRRGVTRYSLSGCLLIGAERRGA